MTVEALENRLNEVGTIAFRCNNTFIGMYKAERGQRFGKRVEIHEKGETFLIRNDKETNSTGDVYYRINDTDSLFFGRSTNTKLLVLFLYLKCWYEAE